MKKLLLYGNDARSALKAGVDKLAQAVVTTLGPKGRNVAIGQSWGGPTVVHDGVTVAREVELTDPFENMGAEMVKEAASKTNDKAGDGTTTATLLTQVIVEKGFEELSKPKSKVNPMIMKAGMEKAAEQVIKEIESKAKKVKGKDIEKVASVSAQDTQIGKLVAEAIGKVGKDGVVTAEQGTGIEMAVSYREGMEFDKGYASPYFVTDAERMESEIEKPAIILTDARITSFEELIPLIETIIKETKNIVIIADSIEGDALAGLIVNKARGNFTPLAITAPGFGDRKREMLEDIAALTGGTVISEGKGRKLASLTIDDCGKADKVWADQDSTKIIGGKGEKQAIQDRIDQIKGQISRTTSDFDREKLTERLAKLVSGVAIITVGANSEIEMKEKKERVIDAIAATKAALEEGIVAGGGVTLYRAASIIGHDFENDDQQAGADILRKALIQPLLQLASNAGLNPEDVAYEVGTHKDDYGLNVLTLTYGPLIEAGIVDPLKVTRSVVQNAVSVGMMILTTECLIAQIEEKDDRPR